MNKNMISVSGEKQFKNTKRSYESSPVQSVHLEAMAVALALTLAGGISTRVQCLIRHVEFMRIRAPFCSCSPWFNAAAIPADPGEAAELIGEAFVVPAAVSAVVLEGAALLLFAGVDVDGWCGCHGAGDVTAVVVVDGYVDCSG